MPRGLNALFLLFLVDSGSAETFQCTDIQGGPVIVVATVNDDGRTGTVRVAGVTNDTRYRVFGFDRTWAFKDKESGTVYKLRIEPDGTAYSFDDTELDGKATGVPDHVFKCQQQAFEGVSGKYSEAQSDISPIVRVDPVYPARALARGLTGYVHLSFTVTTDGAVQDPIVIYSSDSLFEGSAIRAVSKWKYEPQPVDMTGVKAVVRFVP